MLPIYSSPTKVAGTNYDFFRNIFQSVRFIRGAFILAREVPKDLPDYESCINFYHAYPECVNYPPLLENFSNLKTQL